MNHECPVLWVFQAGAPGLGLEPTGAGGAALQSGRDGPPGTFPAQAAGP